MSDKLTTIKENIRAFSENEKASAEKRSSRSIFNTLAAMAAVLGVFIAISISMEPANSGPVDIEVTDTEFQRGYVVTCLTLKAAQDRVLTFQQEKGVSAIIVPVSRIRRILGACQ
jgi:hypothetical protein